MRRPPDLFLVSHMQAELNRLFDEVLAPAEAARESGPFQPRIDVVDTPEAVLIQVEVAGMRAHELQVVAEGDVIEIQGDKSPRGVEGTRARYHCMERGRGRFARAVRVAEAVNTHRARVRLQRGLLTIELPRVADQRRRRQRLEVEEMPEGKGR